MRRYDITTLVIVTALIVQSSIRAYAGGVKATPPIIFQNNTERAARVSLSNPSDVPIEVWIEAKYGFHETNDTGRVLVIMPDSLNSTDRSAAAWIRAYPDRLFLNPQETQVILLIVTPPAGISPGEYWSRILVSSKNQQTPLRTGMSLEIITQTSLPYHYRHDVTQTGLELFGQVTYTNVQKTLRIQLPLRRTGNASYWGMLTCRLLNSEGNSVFTNEYNLVVYKDLNHVLRIDTRDIPPGNYLCDLVAKTERKDFKRSLGVQSQPVKWTIPVNIP